MPCNCDGLEESAQWDAFKKKHHLWFCVDSDGYKVFSILKSNLPPSDEITRNTISTLVRQCNDLTVMLCAAGRAYCSEAKMPEDVVRWWKEHCVIDKMKGNPWGIEPKEVE